MHPPPRRRGPIPESRVREGAKQGGATAKQIVDGGAPSHPAAVRLLALQRLAGNRAVLGLMASVAAAQRAATTTSPTLAGTEAASGHAGILDNGVLVKAQDVVMGGKKRRLKAGTYVEVESKADTGYLVKVWSGFHGRPALIAPDSFRHEPQIEDVRDKDGTVAPGEKADERVRFGHINGVLWGPQGPRMADIRQGSTGDCYVMAALGAHAFTNVDLIKDMFEEHEPELPSYGVRLWVRQGKGPNANDRRKSIRVSTDFAQTRGKSGLEPAYAWYARTSGPTRKQRRPVLWPLLIEKAMAELLGGFTEMGEGGGDGRTQAVFRAVTGKDPILQSFEPGSGKHSLGMLDPDALENVNWDAIDNPSFMRAMHRVVAEGRAMTAWSRSLSGSDKALLDEEANVYQDHIYMLRGVLYPDIVLLRNPVGEKHPRPLTVTQFRTLFRQVIFAGKASPRRESLE